MAARGGVGVWVPVRGGTDVLLAERADTGGTGVLLANEVPCWLYSCMQVRAVRVGIVENWRELGLRKSQFGEFLQL